MQVVRRAALRPFKSVSALVIIITSTSCREPGPLKAMYDKLYTLQFTDNDHSLQGQCDIRIKRCHSTYHHKASPSIVVVDSVTNLSM